jgi:regulator of sigma E protease
VLAGSPASRAGLQAGDSIVSIGHAPLQRWADLQERVSASPGADLPFEVMRSGKVVALTLRPEPTSVRDPVSKQIKSVGRIGAVGADVTVRVPMSPVQSVKVAGRQTWLTATKIVDVVRGLLTREVSVKQLGGPIAITRASVAAAQSGLESLFLLVALLSVNVAVLNLLPIPILDGGQILLNVAEAAKGSPFSARTREYILRFGLVAILLIFALSTFNDVRDFLARLFA